MPAAEPGRRNDPRLAETAAPGAELHRQLRHPWEELSPALRADDKAYLVRLAGSDPLEALDFRPLRPSSIRTRKRQLGELISTMLHNGVAAEELQSLADVVRLDHVKAGLRFLLARHSDAAGSGASSSPRTQAYQLAQLAVAIARHWVGVDEAELAALTMLRNRLCHGEPGCGRSTAPA